MFSQKTAIAARGKWRGILVELGISPQSLTGKHVACPLCGGKDRFRFDNREGNGTYICNQCGAGTGIRLAEKFLGQDFARVASRIDRIIANVKPGTEDDPQPSEIADEKRVSYLRRLYSDSRPIQSGDPVDRYLHSRGVGAASYPAALRTIDNLPDGEGGTGPAMLAMVGVPGEERFCGIHRTFLKRDGSGKAEIGCPRKMTPGPIPDGACIALSDFESGPLGIAEGIETALAASEMFDIPVWAAINAKMMEKFCPPTGCNELVVFGDNDPLFGGQRAAFHLAHKWAVKRLEVTVHIPTLPGSDWLDELCLRHGKCKSGDAA